jgi:hypothetical protein
MRTSHLLCTSSDILSQFQGLNGIADRCTILYLDKDYDLQISEIQILIWQDQKSISLASGSVIIFLLFRDPHEFIENHTEALNIIENVQLLREGCLLIGAKLFNDPINWRAAYLKTSLLRISKSFPGLVPDSVLVNGIRYVDTSNRDFARVIKSGFGVQRPIDDLYPRATLFAAGQAFLPERRYRYLIQQFIVAKREIRCYVTRFSDYICANLFEMPLGSQSCPDWRDEVSSAELRCNHIHDENIKQLSLQILLELGLEYLCLDYLQDGEYIKLIDINPHGSWAWLSSFARATVDSQIESWLISILSENNVVEP